MKTEFLILAFKNLVRYKTRNTLTGISIAVSALSVVLGLALTDGIIRQTIIGFTGTLVEDVMIFPSKEEIVGGKHVLTQYKEIQQSIYQLEGVDYVTKKLSFKGAAYSPRSSVNALFMGMEPEGIRRKTNLDMINGEYLDDNDKLSLIISKKLAARLEVSVGDTVSIVVNMPRGGINAADFTVKGIFNIKTGLQFVEHLIYIALWDTQDLMGLSGNEVFSLGVYIKDVDKVDDFERIISQKLKREGFIGDAISWKRVLAGVLSVYEFVKTIVFVFTVIMLFIITVGVVNSTFLSISERTKEMGTFMALGLNQKNVIILYLLEGLYIAIVGTVLGCALGSGLSILIGTIGIKAPSAALVYIFGGSHLFPFLRYSTVIFVFFFVTAITTIGTFVPIYNASRLEPTKALSHN